MTYAELVDMAEMCALNARTMRNKDAVRELWTMALEYQQRAARIDGDREPPIGPPPAVFDPAARIGSLVRKIDLARRVRFAKTRASAGRPLHF
jgi:hypothetical protein